MEIVLAVVVKFLSKGNKVLSKHITSYLTHAAIQNFSLLSIHVVEIMDSIISGKLYTINSNKI